MSKAKLKKGKMPVKPAIALQDLIVLAADKNIEEAIGGMLQERAKSLGMRTITYKIITHPSRDPGCLNQSAGILAGYQNTHRHAIVIFDHQGSGREQQSRAELESTVENELRLSGWGERAATVVIDPELENWVWSQSPHIANCLGWKDPKIALHDWLVENEYLSDAKQIKPKQPKEAMEAVLKFVRRPRSSAIYRAIAEKVSLAHCTDPAFAKLCDRLRSWFPGSGK